MRAAPQTRSTAGCRFSPRSLLIIVGSVAMRPPKRSLAIAFVYGPRMISGAVSPMTRARPSRMPVTMPANAVGRTTLMMVFHFGTPSA